MINVNTKEYWESRFLINWGKDGKRQTYEYAKANVQHLGISAEFSGEIVDFGCAMGDSIPVYANSFKKSKIIGIDISNNAIEYCNIKYGKIAKFLCGDYTVIPKTDIIIASHILEHITNDLLVVAELLKKCNVLYIFVPYKEDPLFIEHVNYYDENYYKDLNTLQIKIFNVKYKKKLSNCQILKNLVRFRFDFFSSFSKEIIMFQIKGLL